MTDAENGTMLQAYARQAAAEPYFLAHPLAAHRARYGITEQEQRRHLGVKPREWIPFLLCRMPETEAELQALADRFGCDAERLTRALRAGK
jgi:hypothetical protein